MAALARRLRKDTAAVRRARQRAVKPPRFGRNEIVSGPVAQRTGARLAALGGSNAVRGVNGANGYTGREARLTLNAWGPEKARRRMNRLVGGLIDRPVRADPQIAPRSRERELTQRAGELRQRYPGLSKDELARRVADTRSRGIGDRVRELAHDKSRVGGIGGQVRELARQRALKDVLRARRRRSRSRSRARPRLVRY